MTIDRRLRDVVERVPQARREHEALQAVLRIVPDGLQQVGAVQRLRDVVDGKLRREQPRGIDDDFDLARVAGEHADMADARHARQRRTDHVEPVVVEVRRRQRAGRD